MVKELQAIARSKRIDWQAPIQIPGHESTKEVLPGQPDLMQIRVDLNGPSCRTLSQSNAFFNLNIIKKVYKETCM